MRRGDDFPWREAANPADHPQGRDEEREEGPLSEEFVTDATMRKRAAQVAAQLEQARAQEATFERRHGMSFEEFQAAFDPQADAAMGEDYLEWSRAAERVRMLRYELQRLSQRGKRRAQEPPPADDDEQQDRRGPVS